MNRPRFSQRMLRPRSFEILWNLASAAAYVLETVRSAAHHKSPSADDDPIFWRSFLIQTSPASVQCPMKEGRGGGEERENEEMGRERKEKVQDRSLGKAVSARRFAAL